MWMPRVSGAYTIGERTVLKGGYGLFYDTLNAGDYTGFNQIGYSSATTNVDQHGFRPDAGCSAIRPTASRRSTDPFPVRADGGRFEQPIEDALGVDAILGTNFTREDPNRSHPRVQRWRHRRAAGAAAQSGGRGRLYRLVRGPCRPAHRRSLRARAVLQQRDERPRRDAADAAAAAGAEPVQHRQLRLAGDDQPGAVSAAGRQLVLHRGDECSGRTCCAATRSCRG